MAAGGPGRVLVVDDDRVIRVILVRALEREGFVVDQASDGLEALDLLANRTPDLVLLDITLPRLSGLEVLSAIRQRFGSNDLPVMMLSARSEVDDVMAALQFGANDYITKPIDFGLLVRRSTAAIQHRRLVQHAMLLAHRLQLLQECGGLLVSLHGPDGRFLEASTALCTALGLRREQLAAYHLHDLLHPRDAVGLAELPEELPDTYRLLARVRREDRFSWFELEQAALRDGVTHALRAVHVVWSDRSRELSTPVNVPVAATNTPRRSFAFTPAPTAERRTVTPTYGPPVDADTTPIPWPRDDRPPRVAPGLDPSDQTSVLSRLESIPPPE